MFEHGQYLLYWGAMTAGSPPLKVKKISRRMQTVQSKKIEPKKLITHRFKPDQIIEAYDTFEHAAKEKALKVILEN
jgi:threonine dehydrogenase-like Zn-dependent dehydrogenase